MRGGGVLLADVAKRERRRDGGFQGEVSIRFDRPLQCRGFLLLGAGCAMNPIGDGIDTAAIHTPLLRGGRSTGDAASDHGCGKQHGRGNEVLRLHVSLLLPFVWQ